MLQNTRITGELERAKKVTSILEEGKKEAENRVREVEEKMMELEEIGTKLLKSEIRKLEQKVSEVYYSISSDYPREFLKTCFLFRSYAIVE